MNVFVEKFADLKILRYKLSAFEKLNLQQKQYVYYLSLAALCGRDILWDQNNRYNLKIRKLLEAIYESYSGDRESDIFSKFMVYLKRVWFSNGIHHHYSMDKIIPTFSRSEFLSLIDSSDLTKLSFVKEIDELIGVIIDPERESKRVSLDSNKDLLNESSMNYYEKISQAEAESFYEEKRKLAGEKAPAFGLNSKLVKEGGEISEKQWKINGLYGNAIKQIVFYLEKAIPFAENQLQKQAIENLVNYYRTGDLKLFDDYSISWVKEMDGDVDFVNGFIEIYGDPLGIKGSWESIVNYKNHESTKRATVLSENAGWFEANSPVKNDFKKDTVKGVSAKVINVAMLGGDCHPYTPIGVNLPNSEWIREEYGSKSVTIENITKAYFEDSLNNGLLEEFAGSKEEIERARDYGYLAGNLHTDLHECLGHGSGKMMPGVNPEDLKNYYSTIEETRADLFALYYILDEKMIELGLIPSSETGKAEYDAYIRNGLITQLTRIEPGKDIEESHMRNRQLIARWAYEKGKDRDVVNFFMQEGKTCVRVNDYYALRSLFGELLAEVQRIKSEGDYGAAKQLVESYGVKVDKKLHEEVLRRFAKLDIAPYAGFLNPELSLAKNDKGEVVDVLVNYVDSFAGQMMDYSKRFGFLLP